MTENLKEEINDTINDNKEYQIKKYPHTEQLNQECKDRLLRIFRDHPNINEKIEEIAEKIHNCKISQADKAFLRVHQELNMPY